MQDQLQHVEVTGGRGSRGVHGLPGDFDGLRRRVLGQGLGGGLGARGEQRR
jgi:hypothetical protein